MKIQIGKQTLNTPEAMEDVAPNTLYHLFHPTDKNLFKVRLNLFLHMSGIKPKLLKQWEADAGEDFIHELVEVVQSSTAFLFEEIPDTADLAIDRKQPPFKGVGFGEGFQDATFDDFAMVDKLLQEGNQDELLKVVCKESQAWESWQINAILYYIIACHALIIDAIPVSMKKQNANAQPNPLGWASVQMSLAGDKIGNYQEVKSTNVWDVVVLLRHIDEQNHAMKNSSKK